MSRVKSKTPCEPPTAPSIGCALAMPIIKVPSKKSTKPITAQVSQAQQQIAFGCSIAVPTCKE